MKARGPRKPSHCTRTRTQQEVHLLVAGLTGGIASGKSTVARIMHQAGAVIIDADRIARVVVAPGLPAWQEIRTIFSDAVLLADGRINRELLGRIVFADATLRHRLERIIHPRVDAEITAQLADTARTRPDAVVLLDVPLLFETGRTEGLAEIIVVYVPESVQCRRLMQRDGLTETEAKARIRAQIPIAEKKRKASIIIDNSGSLANTKEQALAVFRELRRRSGVLFWKKDTS